VQSTPPPSAQQRRNRLVLGVSAATVGVVLAGTVVGLVIGQDRPPAPKPPAQQQESARTTILGGDAGVQITSADLEALATARSQALKAGDRAGFLAAVDPRLHTQQGRLFDNLRKLEFTTGDYVTIDQRGRSADRFGRGVTVDVDVAWRHRIAGYDPEPVDEWYRWTITKKDASSPPSITAVTAAPAGAASASRSVMYPAPWDAWKDMRVVRTAHTLLLVDAPMLRRAEQLAPVAEKAASTVLAAWADAKVQGRAFDRFVTVLVPDKKQLTTMYQVIDGESPEAGRMMPMPVVGTDDRTGTTRTVVDTSSSFFTGRGDAGEIFRHEYAHAVIEGMATTDHPDANVVTGLQTWVIEGFAEYVANRGGGAGMRAAAGEARVRAGFDGELPPPGEWESTEPGVVSHYYYLAHQAFRYIAQRHGGPAKAFGFAAAYYRGGASLDEILQRELGVDRAAFESGWAQFVRAEAR
jgi:hypothetical protein